jgi:hypothetical protein
MTKGSQPQRIELAWLWLLYQPDSDLSVWFPHVCYHERPHPPYLHRGVDRQAARGVLASSRNRRRREVPSSKGDERRPNTDV